MTGCVVQCGKRVVMYRLKTILQEGGSVEGFQAVLECTLNEFHLETEVTVCLTNI